uniref:UPF0606 protein KIAA1549-like n=1 Tax=Myxine glutinosa TaxID=7769 RepID=UPI00358F73FA
MHDPEKIEHRKVSVSPHLRLVVLIDILFFLFTFSARHSVVEAVSPPDGTSTATAYDGLQTSYTTSTESKDSWEKFQNSPATASKAYMELECCTPEVIQFSSALAIRTNIPIIQHPLSTAPTELAPSVLFTTASQLNQNDIYEPLDGETFGFKLSITTQLEEGPTFIESSQELMSSAFVASPEYSNTDHDLVERIPFITSLPLHFNTAAATQAVHLFTASGSVTTMLLPSMQSSVRVSQAPEILSYDLASSPYSEMMTLPETTTVIPFTISGEESKRFVADDAINSQNLNCTLKQMSSVTAWKISPSECSTILKNEFLTGSNFSDEVSPSPLLSLSEINGTNTSSSRWNELSSPLNFLVSSMSPMNIFSPSEVKSSYDFTNYFTVHSPSTTTTLQGMTDIYATEIDNSHGLSSDYKLLFAKPSFFSSFDRTIIESRILETIMPTETNIFGLTDWFTPVRAPVDWLDLSEEVVSAAQSYDTFLEIQASFSTGLSLSTRSPSANFSYSPITNALMSETSFSGLILDTEMDRSSILSSFSSVWSTRINTVDSLPTISDPWQLSSQTTFNNASFILQSSHFITSIESTFVTSMKVPFFSSVQDISIVTPSVSYSSILGNETTMVVPFITSSNVTPISPTMISLTPSTTQSLSEFSAIFTTFTASVDASSTFLPSISQPTSITSSLSWTTYPTPIPKTTSSYIQPLACNITSSMWVVTGFIVNNEGNITDSILRHNLSRGLEQSLSKALRRSNINVQIMSLAASDIATNLEVVYLMIDSAGIFMPWAICKALMDLGDASLVSNMMQHADGVVVPETCRPYDAFNHTQLVQTVLQLVDETVDVRLCHFSTSMENGLRQALLAASSITSRVSYSVQMTNTSRSPHSLVVVLTYMAKQGAQQLDGTETAEILRSLSPALLGFYLGYPPSILAEPIVHPMLDTSLDTRKYWVKTVILAVTDADLGNLLAFTSAIERGLARLYDRALSLQAKSRHSRAARSRDFTVQVVNVSREPGKEEPVSVVHYAQHGNISVLASSAATLLSNLDLQTAAIILGYRVQTLATVVERQLGIASGSTNLWIIPAVLVPTVFFLALIVALLFWKFCHPNSSEFKADTMSNIHRTKSVQGFDYAKKALGSDLRLNQAVNTPMKVHDMGKHSPGGEGTPAIHSLPPATPGKVWGRNSRVAHSDTESALSGRSTGPDSEPHSPNSAFTSPISNGKASTLTLRSRGPESGWVAQPTSLIEPPRASRRSQEETSIQLLPLQPVLDNFHPESQETVLGMNELVRVTRIPAENERKPRVRGVNKKKVECAVKREGATERQRPTSQVLQALPHEKKTQGVTQQTHQQIDHILDPGSQIPSVFLDPKSSRAKKGRKKRSPQHPAADQECLLESDTDAPSRLASNGTHMSEIDSTFETVAATKLSAKTPSKPTDCTPPPVPARQGYNIQPGKSDSLTPHHNITGKEGLVKTDEPTIDEARRRMHSLLDEAFALVSSAAAIGPKAIPTISQARITPLSQTTWGEVNRLPCSGPWNVQASSEAWPSQHNGILGPSCNVIHSTNPQRISPRQQPIQQGPRSYAQFSPVPLQSPFPMAFPHTSYVQRYDGPYSQAQASLRAYPYAGAPNLHPVAVPPSALFIHSPRRALALPAESLVLPYSSQNAVVPVATSLPDSQPDGQAAHGRGVFWVPYSADNVPHREGHTTEATAIRTVEYLPSDLHSLPNASVSWPPGSRHIQAAIPARPSGRWSDRAESRHASSVPDPGLHSGQDLVQPPSVLVRSIRDERSRISKKPGSIKQFRV